MLDGLFQLFAGPEFYNVGCFNFDGRTGLRIAAFSGLTTGFGKCPEADQGDFSVFFLE